MKIISAQNPKYTKDGHIDLILEVEGLGVIPFTAAPDDVEEHGRQLYEMANRGDFGPVAAYPEPPK